MDKNSTVGKNPDDARNPPRGEEDVEYVEIIDDGSYEYYEEYEDDDSVEEIVPPPFATPFPYPPPPRGPLRRWQPAPPQDFVYEEEIVEESDSANHEGGASERAWVEYSTHSDLF